MSDSSTTVTPQAAPAASGTGSAPTDQLYGLMAEFDTPAAIYEAAKKVRDAGYRWWDCHTPFPVHGLDKAMGVKPTILPILVFICGLAGATFGFILQWFTNASSFDLWSGIPDIWVRGYDFLISGKPMLSGAVYPIVMFELTILFAAGGCVILMLVMNGLPRLYHPCLKSKRFQRASDDRFFIVVEARDPQFYRSRTEEFLQSLNPISIEALEA